MIDMTRKRGKKRENKSQKAIKLLYESFSTKKLCPDGDSARQGGITVKQPAEERITHPDTEKNWEANEEGFKKKL